MGHTLCRQRIGQPVHIGVKIAVGDPLLPGHQRNAIRVGQRRIAEHAPDRPGQARHRRRISKPELHKPYASAKGRAQA